MGFWNEKGNGWDDAHQMSVNACDAHRSEMPKSKWRKSDILAVIMGERVHGRTPSGERLEDTISEAISNALYDLVEQPFSETDIAYFEGADRRRLADAVKRCPLKRLLVPTIAHHIGDRRYMRLVEFYSLDFSGLFNE